MSNHLINIFLDAEHSTPKGWTRGYWPDEAIALLQAGKVAKINLDHDLGDDARCTGYDVIPWIEKAVRLRGFVPPRVRMHSANAAASICILAGIRAIEQAYCVLTPGAERVVKSHKTHRPLTPALFDRFIAGRAGSY